MKDEVRYIYARLSRLSRHLPWDLLTVLNKSFSVTGFIVLCLCSGNWVKCIWGQCLEVPAWLTLPPVGHTLCKNQGLYTLLLAYFPRHSGTYVADYCLFICVMPWTSLVSLGDWPTAISHFFPLLAPLVNQSSPYTTRNCGVLWCKSYFSLMVDLLNCLLQFMNWLQFCTTVFRSRDCSAGNRWCIDKWFYDLGAQ
jgi:hypothetical protein